MSLAYALKRALGITGVSEAALADDPPSGTFYDPKVVVALKAIIDAYADRPWGIGCARVPIAQLDVGMTLADDLYTDSGLKLLAKDTELTLTNLETILWRHRFDPIVRGAVVYRKSA